MGKKPVVVVVGLIWAGMVLVGCENCKNCRKKYDPAPTFGAKADAPVVKQDAIPSVVKPTATAGGSTPKPETAKATDPVGTQGFEKTPVGTPTSADAATSPTMQKSLSPTTDARPALPGQDAMYRSGEMPISKSAPSDTGSRLPPRPSLSQASASVAETLPPISEPSALPRSPLSAVTPPVPPSTLSQPPTAPLPPSTLPQPPVPALPLPGSSGNGLPAIDSIPK